jgi:hypothetical protein
VNRTEQGPRRPRVDFDTWKSLSKEDQVAWDTVSDKGKSMILTYMAKNSSKFTGILKNGDKKTRFANDVTTSRQVNSHEQNMNANTKTNTNSNNMTIEVSTHQLLPKHTSIPKPMPNDDFNDILTMATTKTTPSSIKTNMPCLWCSSTRQIIKGLRRNCDYYKNNHTTLV